MAVANKVGYVGASAGPLNRVDTAQTNPLGLRVQGDDGGEYLYLQGIASTVIGSCVTYGLSATSQWLTALSVTGAKGPVAIAMAAVLASQFGWYQIWGLAQANFNGAAVAGAALYSAGTGLVDDAIVSGDQITGACVAATVGGAGLGAVFLQHPFMNHLG